MNANFFDEEQLLDPENDDVGEGENMKELELEVVVEAIWEKKNGL